MPKTYPPDFRGLKQRHDALRRDVQRSIDQADRGEVEPWDIDIILAEAHRRGHLPALPDGIQVLLVTHGARDIPALYRRLFGGKRE